MGTESVGSSRRSSLWIGVLLLGLLATAIAIVVAVFSSAAASERASKEGAEAVLLAKMQASIQQVAVRTGEWLESPTDAAAFDPAEPSMVEAVAEFKTASAALLELIDADESDLVASLNAGFDEYVSAVGTLASLGRSPMPAGTRARIEALETALRSPLLELQLEENEHLLESVEQEAAAVLVLQRLVPGLLALGAVLAFLAIRLQWRSRRLEELEALHTAKDEFVASVSHELRTPLSAVVGLAAELRDRLGQFDRDEVAELATVIAEQSNEVAHIVEDLLVAARIEAGNLTIAAKRISLREQVDSALLPFKEVLPSGQLVSGRAVAYADGGRVRQILRNLIGNALRHGGDRVTVNIESDRRGAVVTVADNGSGLPESEWETIFDAYHRVRDVPGLAPSVGLGLTVSRRLARQMSGDLTYRYTDGWSSFELILPVAAPTETSSPVGVGAG